MDFGKNFVALFAQMDFGESFVTLFTQMHVATAILLGCGLVLILLELFEPGFGVFGALGGCSLLACIILQLILSDYNFVQIAILVMLILLVLFIEVFLVMFLMKRKWFARSPLVQNETALPVDGKTKGTEDFSFLLDKEGIAKTFLRPVGKAEFEGREYDVVAYQGTSYQSGTVVKVVEVEGQRIVVKAMD